MLKDYLNSVLYFFIIKFNFILNLNVNFYFVSGDTVTAKFISKYMAKKLSSGYFIKELLTPLKKELKQVMKVSISLLYHYKNLVKKEKITRGGYRYYAKMLYFSLIKFYRFYYKHIGLCFFRK